MHNLINIIPLEVFKTLLHGILNFIKQNLTKNETKFYTFLFLLPFIIRFDDNEDGDIASENLYFENVGK